MAEKILQDHYPDGQAQKQFLNCVNMKYTLGLLSKTDQQIILQQVKQKRN